MNTKAILSALADADVIIGVVNYDSSIYNINPSWPVFFYKNPKQWVQLSSTTM